MIKLIKISKAYKKSQKKVLNNISYSFDNNKLYAILGESGSGKTTLLNILGLLDNASSGKILFDNNIISSKQNINYMKEIGIIFQSCYINENLNVYDNVLIPLLINKKIKKSERKTKILNTLKILHIEDKIKNFPHSLSGGEKQRLAIAIAIVSNPNIIIADEPTSNLDTKNEEEIFNIFKSLALNGKCVIVASHSEKIINFADETLLLENGKLRSILK